MPEMTIMEYVAFVFIVAVMYLSFDALVEFVNQEHRR